MDVVVENPDNLVKDLERERGVEGMAVGVLSPFVEAGEEVLSGTSTADDESRLMWIGSTGSSASVEVAAPSRKRSAGGRFGVEATDEAPVGSYHETYDPIPSDPID